MRFAGRPATEAGVDNQGDHVIPFGLIKRGVLRHFRLNPAALGAELQVHEEDADASDDRAALAADAGSSAAHSGEGGGGDAPAGKPEDELPPDMDSVLENELGEDDQAIDKANKIRRNKVIAFIKSLSVLELNSDRLLTDDLEALSAIQDECDAEVEASKAASARKGSGGGGGSDGGKDHPAASEKEAPDAPVIEAYLKALLNEYKLKRTRKLFFKAQREWLDDPKYLSFAQSPEVYLIEKAIRKHASEEEKAKQSTSKSEDLKKGEALIDERLVDALIEVFAGKYRSGKRRKDLNSLRERFKAIKQQGLTVEAVIAEARKCGLDAAGEIRRSIAKGHSDNRDLVATVCERLSEGALSYYNRLPGGSYQQTKRVVPQAPVDRLSERDALDYLDDKYDLILDLVGDKIKVLDTLNKTISD